MKKGKTSKLIFKGIVQGVGFRPTIYRIAEQLGSHGYVLNKGAEVEVVIDTDPTEFIDQVKKHLPSLAKITSIKTVPLDKNFDTFKIRHSSQGSRESLIPVDTALCPECVKELFDPTNRRYHFPFTNCTVCGARFSVIEDVPYDRERTAMREFELCENCQKEYQAPFDRRYHAQTISCPQCGPRYDLYDSNGKRQEYTDPIQRFAEMMDEGSIGVIKSWGGMHLSCNLDQIQRFRKWYHRPEKAFAVMVKDIETARAYAEISAFEASLLQSNQRPIVLVQKKDLEDISPGLDSIGLFLPYTGVHHLLFSSLSADALIMTSANIPGEPMITENETAFSLQADCYLLHNRKIPNRTDDTVIKPWKDQYFFLRKSRGYVPDPLDVSYDTNILSVGAGENIHGALSVKKKLYLTQYIGNGAYYPTLRFLKKALDHLMTLTMRKPDLDAVGIDLHPGYETRLIAKEFSETSNVPSFEVLHHHAHAASLLLDSNVDESVVLTLDGLGYGDDETFWGGEILFTDIASYERVAHLKPIPLIGGDQAAMDPRRVIYALLKDETPSCLVNSDEKRIFDQLISRAPLSSSLGRILDALSCYLGICCKRTYDGEPAMKLERYLARGKPTVPFDVSDFGSVFNTSELFLQLHEHVSGCDKPLSEKEKADISTSFVRSLADWFAQRAITYACEHDISSVGLTGGIAYNIPFLEMTRSQVEDSDLCFLVHSKLPSGDGGISSGQNVIVSKMI